MKKIWYKVSTKGGGWCKYSSLKELIAYKKSFPYHKILKITEIIEQPLSQQIVDDINSKIDWKD